MVAKMLKKIILSMLSLFIFCGCSSSIAKTSVSQEIHDLEETHIASDYSLIFQQYDFKFNGKFIHDLS